MKQVGRPGVGGQQNVEVAVVVDVAISRGPRHLWRREGIPHLRRDFGKFSPAEVAEQMRGLGIADPLLHALDLIFNMAVGHENVPVGSNRHVRRPHEIVRTSSHHTTLAESEQHLALRTDLEDLVALAVSDARIGHP